MMATLQCLECLQCLNMFSRNFLFIDFERLTQIERAMCSSCLDGCRCYYNESGGWQKKKQQKICMKIWKIDIPFAGIFRGSVVRSGALSEVVLIELVSDSAVLSSCLYGMTTWWGMWLYWKKKIHRNMELSFYTATLRRITFSRKRRNKPLRRTYSLHYSKWILLKLLAVMLWIVDLHYYVTDS